jgi:phosphatidylserine/phosphatidylglycerophosphate/cardiolipin synthase-like enzyme
VDVEVIVDKTSTWRSKSGSHYSAATYLTNAGVPVWVDTKVAIAHNKVMVLVGTIVITGSFNFTAAAQKSNPENLLVLDDPTLASEYKANWERRRAVSERYRGALPPATAAEAEKATGRLRRPLASDLAANVIPHLPGARRPNRRCRQRLMLAASVVSGA